MALAIRTALVLLGAGLITLLVIQSGPRAVWEMIRSLGPLAPLALLPYAFVYILDTLGWYTSFPTESRNKVGFWRFSKIRWAGEATNYILPTAYVGGEALKVYLLSLRGIATSQGATSAVTSKTAQTLAQVLFLFVGAIVALQQISEDSSLRLGLIVVSALAACGFVFLLSIQRFGFFRIISIIGKRLGIGREFLSRKQSSIEATDRQIQDFYRRSPRRFYLCVAYYFAGWLADTIEIYLISHLIQSPITWTQALAIEAFIGVAKILGMFVPGSLGIQESGVVLLCRLFGLPIVFGTSYALLRRLREICYAAVGWILLYSEFPNLDTLRQTLRRLKEQESQESNTGKDAGCT